MSNYTAEQLETFASLILSDKGKLRAPRVHIAEMLRDYADLLRERESAKAGVTDEAVIRIARELEQAGWATGGDFDGDFLPDVRAALEAVAPMLTSARVLDDVQRYHLLRSGKSGISLPLGAEALDLYLDRKLAAATKPEKE